MPPKKVKLKKGLKSIGPTKTSWLNKRLALKYFWPIFGVLFFLFLLSIFNLLSLWQIRQEMNVNMEELKANISLDQEASSVKDSNDFLFDGSALVSDSSITELASSSSPEAMPRAGVVVVDRHTENSPVVSVITIDPSDGIMSAIFGDGYETPTTNSNTKVIVAENILIDEIVPNVDTAAIIATNPSYSIPSVSEQLLSGRLASISDTFSGLVNINQSETSMFWDENVTAFIFPPVYELNKQSDCSVPDCGLSREMTDIQSSCLDAGCLSKLSDTELSFAGKELQLPPVFNNKKINNINIFSLSDYWLLGIVTGSSTAEQGWVYRFDGLSFSPLITNETEYQIKPRFQHGGGEIAFGGDDKDFLVLYSGYDAVAYRFREGRIEDISKYFGLRVSSGGFRAQILKIGVGQSSIYYVCSLDDYKAKIVKIWSKDDLNSAGAFDFSTIFGDASFRPQSILCGISDAQTKKILIAAKIRDTYELWNFQDKGFDNSGLRQVTSVNLKANNQKLVKAAVISDLGLETKSGCPGSGASVYLANKKEDFNAVSPYLWHGFSELGSELYWRFVFSPENDSFYSPWFNHINRLSYLSPEE
jgi:hypothetical protein